MKISAISRGGVIGVDAHTRVGVFQSLHAVDVTFAEGGFLRVPGGFWFDGASIPPRARSLIQSLSIAGYVAFLLHDYAYANGARWIAATGAHIPISRHRADALAFALCEWLGLDDDDSRGIHAALRIFGGSSFRALPVVRTREQLLAR